MNFRNIGMVLILCFSIGIVCGVFFIKDANATSITVLTAITDGNHMGITEEKHDFVISALDLEYDVFSPGGSSFIFETFAGYQFSPDDGTMMGFSGIYKYTWRDEKRVKPFILAGAGITLTDISYPDLYGAFQFNIQAGCGVEFQILEYLAFTSQVREIHLSCAGIDWLAGSKAPYNRGLNTTAILFGLTYYL